MRAVADAQRALAYCAAVRQARMPCLAAIMHLLSLRHALPFLFHVHSALRSGAGRWVGEAAGFGAQR